MVRSIRPIRPRRAFRAGVVMWALVAGMLVAAAAPAVAAEASIATGSPLELVEISDTLNCEVHHVDDGRSEFYGGDACGTLVAVDGVLYGPDDIPAGPSAGGYVNRQQGAVTGSGTAADPWRIETTVDVGDTGLRLRQVDTYVDGQEQYRTSITLTRSTPMLTSEEPIDGILYRAADCYLAGSDDGYGAVDPERSSVACTTGPGGTRTIQWIPQTAGANYYEAGYGEVWDVVEALEPFPDTCRCDEHIDNGAGISWSFSLAPDASLTFDSVIAFTTPPPAEGVTVEDVDAGPSGAVVVDEETGQFTVTMPRGDRTDVTVDLALECSGDATLEGATLTLAGTVYAMEPTDHGTWATTVPADELTNGDLIVELTCSDGETPSGSVGRIVLYDPSGFITDASSGLPVAGATVTLHQVPGWEPRTEDGEEDPETSCETTMTRSDGTWSQPAPEESGVVADPNSGLIDPDVNPQRTNAVGYYGWDVAEGCWYVTVTADGYEDLTSPVVGVPPEVTDLDLELTPLADAPAPAPGSGGNQDPAAQHDTATVAPGATARIDVLANDTDPDGDALSFVITEGPAAGEAARVDGLLEYTAPDEATEDQVVHYRLSDGRGGVDFATVTITIGDATTPGSSGAATADPQAASACPEGQVPEGDDGVPSAHRHTVACADWWGVTSSDDGDFPAGDDLRRGEIAAWLAAALEAAGVELPADPADAFVDDDGHEFERPLDQLAALGIFQGRTATTVEPDAAMSRAHAAALLTRAHAVVTGRQLTADASHFTDDDGHRLEASIDLAHELGIVVGVTPTTFEPNVAVRHDQAATMLMRLLDVLVQEGHTAPPGS